MSSELKEKLEKLRQRLLDLTRRNPLIQFNHQPNSRNPNKQRFIRLVNEIPENLIDKLQKNKRFKLEPKSDTENYDFNLKFASKKTSALVIKDSKKIQAYEEEPKFSLSCNLIRSDSNSFLRDKGINVLYVAIGFLRYTSNRGAGTRRKSKDSDKKENKSPIDIHAPLILYPIKLTREKTGSGFNYFLESEENEIILNESLKSKLIKEEGVNLPDLKLDKDEKPKVEEYFKEINNAIAERNEINSETKWELKRWATLGIFKFGKLAIWDDINFDSWTVNPLEKKQLVKDFINGVPTSSVDEIGNMDFEQDKFEENQILGAIPKLIADADSTQYKVIVKALEGKSMAVEGPPGTGKSQTITNIIGGLLEKNKKVLFAADKLAALEVVKRRLDQKDLGEYILELHNPTKSKKEFHEDIAVRMTKQRKKGFFKESYRESFDELKLLRKELNDYGDCINQRIKINNEKTYLFDLMWKDIINKLALNDPEKIKLVNTLQDDHIEGLLIKITKDKVDLIKSNLNLLAQSYKEINGLELSEILNIKSLPDTEEGLEKLISLSSKLITLIEDLDKDLEKNNLELKNILRIDKKQLDCDLAQFKELISFENLNSDFIIDNDISVLLSNIYKLVVDREAKEKDIEEWAKPFLDNHLKFESLENCLNEIKDLKPSNNSTKIEDILSQLKSLYEFSSFFIREISRKDKRINSQISINEISEAIFSYKVLKEDLENQEDNIFLLLDNSSDSNELSRIITKIKEIQRNNSQSKKLLVHGIDIKKTLEYGSEELKRSIEVVRDASFMGCLFDKEVRLVKKSWNKVSVKGRKRPPLPQLAKIYSIASEYCQNIKKENTCDFNSISLDELKEISNQIDFKNQTDETLIRLKSKFKSINTLRIIFEIINNKDNQDKLPKGNLPIIHNFDNLSLNKVVDLSNTIATTIYSKLKLLGDNPSQSILITPYSNIEFILEDIKSLKNTISELKIIIKNTNLYIQDDLEYSLKSIDINKLLGIIGNIDLTLYKSLHKEQLEDYSLSNITTFLKQIKEYYELYTDIAEASKKPVINSFLVGSLGSDFDLTVLSDIKELLLLIQKTKEDIASIIEVKRLRTIIKDYGLKNGIDDLIRVSSETNLDTGDIFQYLYVKSQLKQVSIEEKINKFTGNAITACRNQFRKADPEFIENTSRYIDDYLNKDLSRLLIDTDNASKSPKDLTEGKLIIYEGDKTRRHLPYRKFFKQARNSLQRLKPCFMMSPTSAAQCLPKQIDIFDVLIIDEASQMNPEEAIGLIARCKQIIIVGDQKQLPPDNRWKSSLNDDDDDDYSDSVEMDINESILELATKVLNTKDCSLGWHYRSTHNSLIDFSNKFFYKNALTIFPSNEIGSRINLVKVENPHYHQGLNKPEVLTVIETLKSQIKEDPTKTILIASMNKDQADEIQIELDKICSEDNLVSDYISSHKGNLEELMIKNLENIQGDERDVVIISTVYGPDENGRVMQRFGDVSTAQGDRRLNVLLTRAKDKIFLVTSLKSTDIRPKSSVTGAKYLKEYLAYAETGKIVDTTVRSSGRPENIFEEGIMNALTKRGYEVDAQVGCLNYSIDLCIKDPRDTSRYILAVECDGASYHSGYSARVSDRLRQQVLEKLGWNVFRIWSTDWWRNPQQELQLLDEKVNELISQKNHEDNLQINNFEMGKQKSIFEE